MYALSVAHKYIKELGVVIRIDNDIMPRAWKLKTLKHQELTKKAHDKGEVDMEEMDGMEAEDFDME